MKFLERTRIKYLIQIFEPHLFFDQMKRALLVLLEQKDTE